MESIKFSRTYSKMPINVGNGSIVKLIDVFKTKFEDLHDSFVKYDTKFYCEGCYKLPQSGDCLVLLMLGDGAIHGQYELFTTVRRSTPSKKEYYRRLRGEKLLVRIEVD